MKTIKAIKTAQQEMLPVTGNELKVLKNSNSNISISEYDYINTDMATDTLVGYVAGDVHKLNTDEEGFDVWFINKEFFDENYTEVDLDLTPVGNDSSMGYLRTL